MADRVALIGTATGGLTKHDQASWTPGDRMVDPDGHVIVTSASTTGMINTVPFYEGSNAPPMINIDDYDFEDAAEFQNGTVQDVIFRVDVTNLAQSGIRFVMRYFMTTAHTGTLRLRLDYRIKDTGDAVSGGSNYMTLLTFDPVNTANEVAWFNDVTVPAGRVVAATQLIHCRFSRIGNDVADTHDGSFCLLNIQPVVL